MTRVLACGGLTIDWLQTSGGRVGPSLGGNAAYSAVGAWLARAEAEVVAVIGEDYPAELLDQLSTAGIGTSSVRVDLGPSFRVLLDESGPRRIISYLPGSGRNDRLDPLPSQLPAPAAGDAMHICAIPAASQLALLDAGRSRGQLVTLDTVIIAGEIEPDTEALLDLARRATVFMPSRDEVEHHWPGDIEAALDHLNAAGCARVVVKLGADGSIGREGGATVRQPAVATDVVDPIGAGDAYCGAACARLAMGESLGEAMSWGAAAASVIIEGHGAARALTSAARNLVAERARSLRAAPITA
jgi:sugar/nucleoside kinase (ribokinase family)